MSVKFDCDKCGKCCQSLNKSHLYDDLNDGTGKCIYYDASTCLCTIYDQRPEKCNVLEMFKYFSTRLTIEEYMNLNKQYCINLKEEK